MNKIKFEFEWSQAADPDPRRANTAAELIILINEVSATRLFDSWSKTVTDRARVPLYPVAEWFAMNWWRLHAEPPFESGGRPPVEWRLAHDLGAVGGGFVWPRVRFAFDGVAIQASARAIKNAPWEPVRHLNDVPVTQIETETFDRAVDEFIMMVIQRLEELRVSAEPLTTLWADVLAERADPEVATWRRWEARLGYGADEAPEALMREIEVFSGRVGAHAAEELAPLLRPNEVLNIQRFNELALAPGIEAHPLHELKMAIPAGAPWEVGRELAHSLRKQAGLGLGPLEDSALTDLLGADRNAFVGLTVSDAKVGLGVRFPQQDKTVLHFRKRNSQGVRFEAARFLADHIISSSDDTWLPLTDRATVRQKTQRAFAAELLAPIGELSDFVGDSRLPEKIEDAGEYYGISPLAIRSHLANHGLLTPEEVAA